jgi:hypothetical protein
MSRGITSALNTEFTATELEPFFAVDMAFDGGNFRVWTGFGSITVDGETYVGGGDILNISEISETGTVQANGVTIGLSGLNSALIASALTETYQGRSVKIYFGALSNGAVVADPYIVFSGRMDVMTIDDAGETSSIAITAESRLIDLDRSRERRYTAEDQKIDFPDDLGLNFIADLQDKQILWGR